MLRVALTGVWLHPCYYLFPTLLLMTEHKYKILKSLFSSSSQVYNVLYLLTVFTNEISGRKKVQVTCISLLSKLIIRTSGNTHLLTAILSLLTAQICGPENTFQHYLFWGFILYMLRVLYSFQRQVSQDMPCSTAHCQLIEQSKEKKQISSWTNFEIYLKHTSKLNVNLMNAAYKKVSPLFTT